MKKRILCVLLAFVMVFGLMSTAVCAAEEPDIWVGGVGMTDGDYLAVGATATTTTKPSGGYAYYNDNTNTLTLNNYSYSGPGYYDTERNRYDGIYCNRFVALNIKVQGNNSISVLGPDKTCYGIFYRYAVSISGTTGSKLTLKTDASSGSGICTYDQNNSNVTISGVTLEVDHFGCGIYTQADNAGVTIENSNVKITSNSSCLEVRKEISIKNSAVDCVTTGLGDCIDCYKGEISITNSTVNAAGPASGIYTSGNVNITGSNVSAKATSLTASSDPSSWAVKYGSGKSFSVGSGLTVWASGEPDGTLAAYDPESHTTYDLIVVKNPSSAAYKVTFDSNGGSSVASQNVKYYEKATKPANPTKSGYTFKWWELDGESFDFNTPISGNRTLKAVWRDNSISVPQYTVTFDANGGNGTMKAVTLDEGDEYTLPKCGFTAPSGKMFKAWSVNGAEMNVGEKITMTANTTVKAIWIDANTITFDANGGKGTMDEVKVPAGNTYYLPQCQFTPPNGKVFVGWMIDGTLYKAGSSIWMNTSKTAKAVWNGEIKEAHALLYTPVVGEHPDMTPSTYAGENYTVSIGNWYELVSGYPDLTSADTFEDSYYCVRIDFTPKEGYSFTSQTKFYINSEEAHLVGSSGTTLCYEASVDVTEKSALTSINEIRIDGFSEPHVGEACDTKITLNNGLIANEVYWWYDTNNNGAADESNCETFKEGGKYYFRIELMPKEGYTLSYVWEPGIRGGTNYYDGDIWLNGEKLSGRFTCFEQGSGMVIQLWEEAALPPVPVVNPFTDVTETDYFFDAVMWAVKNGVTTGMTATTFGPEAGCTRAHAVTFLWRAGGCPEPSTANHPFTDVEKGGYYEKAVIWAAENGITAGTSATTFSPDANCERGQIVTFLWRLAGEPTPSTSVMPFTDVEKGAYYEKAVLWAVEEGITNGISATQFGPTAQCTRGQIVTFLYRYIEG